MSDWKNVQYKDGKMRTSEGGGGGGSSTFAGLDDVDFSNLQNGQVAKYNSTTQKWENANESGGGGTVTDVQVDGVSVVNQQGVAEIPAIPTVNVDDVKVNGTSVVDANGVAQIISYEEVTQAEYDALPASKTSNGVAYFIKDGGTADGIKVFSLGDIYDSEEHEIGVWTDGKPLYQKTVHISSLPSSTYTSVSYPHGISNIDIIANYFGVMRWANGQVSKEVRFAMFNSNIDNTYGSDMSIEVDKTNILISVGSDRSSMNADITIKYTKTTDVAGSGTLAQGGVPSHHYSTTEKVIGTWIDGKPLYEKTWEFDSAISVASNTLTDVPISNSTIKGIIGVKGYNLYSGKISCWNGLSATADSGTYVKISQNRNNSVAIKYLTLQYTKTTD